MTLSDAIRKGAAQHPQCMGTFFQRDRDGISASCVNGAALVGRFGADTSTEDFAALVDAYPALMNREVGVCPAGPACPRFYTTKPLYLALAHLNDSHYWTREHCADWLEGRA